MARPSAAPRHRQRSRRQERPDDLVGTTFEVEVGAVAHGGHCVARHEGRVVFVRHCLPGERVLARVTEGGQASSYLRADAVEILRPAAGRVPSRCPVSGPGGCGGCDFQHVSTARQRELKADVVAEQLRRLAGLERSVVVETVPGDQDGLAWRTRVQHAVTPDGRIGLRAHRSHQVVVVDTCPIAHPQVQQVELAAPVWRGARRVDVVAPGFGGPLVVVEPVTPGRFTVPPASVLDASVAVAETDEDGQAALQRVRGRTWVSEPVVVDGQQRELRVGGGAFWQVHPGASATLVAAVLDALDPQPGEQALDLYAGVGLFAMALAGRVGPTGAVLAVEGDHGAVRDARRNLHELEHVAITQGRVDGVLAGALADGLTADLVVLDPPRDGAGRTVVEQVAALGPRAVAYVACDPAALARDVRTFSEHGYELAGLRAFDCFPMTHHVECVALLEPVRTEPA